MKNNSRIFTLTIIAILLLAGFAALVAVVPSSPVGTVGATIDPTRDTYVWDGESTEALASNATNWYVLYASNSTIQNNVAPASDSNLVWNGTSTDPCTFDIDEGTAVFYSFTIDTGYSGTVTQGTVNVSVGAGGTSVTSGILTGKSSNTWTNAGDFVIGDSLTNNALNLIMTGDGTTLAAYASDIYLSIRVSANITYTHGGTLASTSSLTVDSGKTLTIPTGKILSLYKTTAAPTLSNSGTIAGPGLFNVAPRSHDISLTLGTINCPIRIESNSGANADRVVSLAADTVLGSICTIQSRHATYTTTLDCADHKFTATQIIVGTRGVLLGGEGEITSTSWDSSAGTWTPETSNVHFAGTGTIKTAAGQTFYNLTVGASASVTQSSNVVVSEWMELDGGAWTKGAYTLTAPLMTISSSITDTGTEDATYSYTPTADQPISSVSVVTNGTWLSIVGTTVVGTPTNTEVGTFYVNVTCTNVIGSVSQNSTITISNTAPVWTTTPSTEWSYGMTYSYDPSASDEGAGLTYSMTTSAIELRCDPTSGAIRGKVLDNSITVSLMADDGNGAVIWQNWTITAMGFSWDGDVVVNYTEGQNLKVTFSASLTNATYNSIIKSVQWNFGDGNGSRVLDLMPMHPYERAGVYMVTCYIVTEDDMTATKNILITVGDPAVVEDLENQYEERMNQAVLISGLACAAGLVIIACYIKIAGRRGWINRLVPVMILVAMLAISATLIGSAMQ